MNNQDRASEASETRCDYCAGTGEVFGKDGVGVPCPHCDGTGRASETPAEGSKPLTDERLEELFETACQTDDGRSVHITFARAIIAALAQAAPSEPVAWRMFEAFDNETAGWCFYDHFVEGSEPLYAAMSPTPK